MKPGVPVQTLPTPGDAGSAILECPPADKLVSPWNRKGGAPWTDRLPGIADWATTISPTSRRNSCGAVRPIVKSSRALAPALAARCNHSQPGESPLHGAWNFLFDPSRPVDQAPAIWRPEDNPGVVVLAQNPGREAVVETVGKMRKVIAEKTTRRGRHLVLAGRHARHRVFLMCPAEVSLEGYLVAADGPLEIRLAALAAFHGNPRSSHSVAARRALKPSDAQAHRLGLLLAILDRLDQPRPVPPTTRQIAFDIIYPGMEGGRAIDWKTSSHRRQAQRLIADARHMRDEGFRKLLVPASRTGFTSPPGAGL